MAAETKTWRRLDAEAIRRGLWDRPRADVRDELITLFMPLAEQVAQYTASKNPQLDVEEATSSAYIGLIKAVDKFNPEDSSRAQFSSFASWLIRGHAQQPARDADFVNHKVRAADRELRARVDAGDPDARACDLLPGMNVTAFSSNPRSGDEGVSLEPTDRAPSSGIEAATEQVAKLMDAADPTVARYLRDGLDTRRQKKGADAGPDFEALSIRWGTSIEGAACIFRSCCDALQDLRVAA